MPRSGRIGVIDTVLLRSSLRFRSYFHLISGARMFKSILQILSFIAPLFKTRIGLQIENLALRHQLCVLRRSVKRPKVRPPDRVLWSLLSRVWSGWKETLIFVKPDT
jgi:hypothetical protein